MIEKKIIITINPGSNSTKVGLFKEDKVLCKEEIIHKLENFQGMKKIWEQIPLRYKEIKKILSSWNFKEEDIFGVVGRGGLLRPLQSGVYLVNEKMLKELENAERGEHASNLGAPITKMIADEYGVKAYIVDPVSVDELSQIARISGVDIIERKCLSHALNTKAVCKRFARQRGKKYENLRLIVAHLGSGISISCHKDGKMIDVNNSMEEGPFGMDRAGGVPVMQILNIIEKGELDIKTLKKKLFGEGGVYSYLKIKNFKELLKMKEEGNEKADILYNAMIYQITKEIGAMAAVLEGNVDAIIITGGIANNEEFVNEISKRIKFIAPVKTYAGEDELLSMAESITSILKGHSIAVEY